MTRLQCTKETQNRRLYVFPLLFAWINKQIPTSLLTQMLRQAQVKCRSAYTRTISETQSVNIRYRSPNKAQQVNLQEAHPTAKRLY